MPISCGEVPRVLFSFSCSAATFFPLNSFHTTLYAILFIFPRFLLFPFGSRHFSRAISRACVSAAAFRRENLTFWHSQRRKNLRSAFPRRTTRSFFSSATQNSRRQYHR